MAQKEVLSVVGIRRRDGGAGPCLAADTPSRDQARSALTADHPAWPPLILEERWRNERRPELPMYPTSHLAWKTVSGVQIQPASGAMRMASMRLRPPTLVMALER